ncbi:MAG: hypothetical protein IT581_08555 [Verrucomicrobiales bacterium]|nr:hypothetical protein [Verrucomicrobiales bacterium]
MSKTTRLQRWLAIFRVILLGAGALAALLALLYAFANWQGSRAWRDERQRIEALGRRTEIQALVPPAVPDHENFARIPLLRPLFDYTRHQGEVWAGVQWRDTNGYRLAYEALAFGDSQKKRFKDPKEPSWTRGERLDLKAWQAAFRNPKQQDAIIANLASTGQNTNLTLLPEDAPAGRDILNLLGQYQKVFDTLATGVLLPHSRFPVHYEEVYSALLPHLHLLKRFTSRFSLRATAYLAESHPDKAAEDVATCLRLADATRTEPFIISQLVRHAALDIALQPAWEGIITHAWTESQLALLQSQFTTIDLMAGWRRGMETERAAAVWAVKKMAGSMESRRLMAEMYEAIGNPSRSDVRPAFPLPYALVAPQGWFYGSLADASKSMEQLENSTPQNIPTLRSSWHPTQQPLRISRLLYHCLMVNGVGKLSVTYINTVRRQIHLELAATACALERHRLANGSYPDTLAPLVPKYLPAVPVDPIDGQPLRYRRDAADRFALWSVGENGTDDGGALPKGGESTTYEGDWVWRWPVQDSADPSQPEPSP